jgi:hypothetical protein
MNYQRVYNQLIAKAQARSNLEGYVEKHHIVPKSLDGSDAFDNLIKLTAREHFIAHCLLAKIHGGTQWLALTRMQGSQRKYKHARLYALARLQVSKLRKGVKRTAATCEAMRIAAKTRKSSPLSIEHKQKISNALANKKRKPLTQAHKDKLSKLLLGKPKNVIKQKAQQ